MLAETATGSGLGIIMDICRVKRGAVEPLWLLGVDDGAVEAALGVVVVLLGCCVNVVEVNPVRGSAFDAAPVDVRVVDELVVGVGA